MEKKYVPVSKLDWSRGPYGWWHQLRKEALLKKGPACLECRRSTTTTQDYCTKSCEGGE